MSKLVDSVKVVENNEDCVILEVIGKPIDMIKLGCFNGDETMIRLTKGDKHTCTVWTKNGNHYSWHWGLSGHSLVSDQMNKQRKLIVECITKDLRIYMGSFI